MDKLKTLLKKLDPGKMPRHIAIIMDGNGRWAEKRGLPRVAGHKKGVDRVRETVRFTSDFLPGVEVLTLFTFSTENWSRPKNEVRVLMELIRIYLIEEIPEMDRNNVRLRWIGRRSGLPAGVLKSLARTEKALEKNTGLILNLAINYGGRAEIIDAAKEFAVDARRDAEKLAALDETAFARYLYTRDLPLLDLLVRTGGEKRISNFLLWQASYAELFFTDKYWPEFSPLELTGAVYDYQRRQRRFGSI